MIDTLQIAHTLHVLCVVRLSFFPKFLRQNLRNQVWLQNSSLERFGSTCCNLKNSISYNQLHVGFSIKALLEDMWLLIVNNNNNNGAKKKSCIVF